MLSKQIKSIRVILFMILFFLVCRTSLLFLIVLIVAIVGLILTFKHKETKRESYDEVINRIIKESKNVN